MVVFLWMRRQCPQLKNSFFGHPFSDRKSDYPIKQTFTLFRFCVWPCHRAAGTCQWPAWWMALSRRSCVFREFEGQYLDHTLFSSKKAHSGKVSAKKRSLFFALVCPAIQWKDTLIWQPAHWQWSRNIQNLNFKRSPGFVEENPKREKTQRKAEKQMTSHWSPVFSATWLQAKARMQICLLKSLINCELFWLTPKTTEPHRTYRIHRWSF